MCPVSIGLHSLDRETYCKLTLKIQLTSFCSQNEDIFTYSNFSYRLLCFCYTHLEHILKNLSLLLIPLFGALFSFISCIDTNSTPGPQSGGGSEVENTQVACTDGIDNNNDGVSDCDDPDCFVFTVCTNVQRDTIVAIVQEHSNSDPVYLSISDDRIIVVDSSYANKADSVDVITLSSSTETVSSEAKDGVGDGNGAPNTSSGSTLYSSRVIQNTSSAEISFDYLENSTILCSDGIDNDGNTLVDCDDSSCFAVAFCSISIENTLAVCSDQIDNDKDGLIDCDDPKCGVFDACMDSTPLLSCYPDGFVFPEFWEIPITIYDYPVQSPILGNDVNYSDGCLNGITKGMVEDTLGANGLPLSKSGECSSALINDWWSPKSVDSTYTGTIELKSIGGSLYTYSTHAQGFFPVPGSCVDGTGGGSGTICESCINGTIPGTGELCSEPKRRNYGFTVHMKYQFTYIEAASREHNFFFSGDDDVFVYMNGHLVIDIGGRHEPQSESFNVWQAAQTLGIKTGDIVSIDFFIAERAALGSQAIIAVNMPCMVEIIQ